MIDPVSLVGIAGAPLVIALVQLVRVTEPDLPSRYVPALTLFMAIGLNLFLAGLIGTPIALALLVGLVTGLTASGLYSHATAGMVLNGRVGEWAIGRGGDAAGSGVAEEVDRA
jgi:hypothetical protein